MTGSFERLEVITGVARRRRWSVEEKLRIIAESLAGGASVSLVAQRNGLRSNQLFKWRKLAREGAFGGFAGDACFVPVRMADDGGPLRRSPPGSSPRPSAAVLSAIDSRWPRSSFPMAAGCGWPPTSSHWRCICRGGPGHPVHNARALADEVLALAFGRLASSSSIVGIATMLQWFRSPRSQPRNARFSNSVSSRSVFARPMLARYGHARRVDDVGFDAACPQPARQPEAVTASLEGNGDTRDRTAGLGCLFLPALQQSKQRLRVRLELLYRVTLDPWCRRPANSPSCRTGVACCGTTCAKSRAKFRLEQLFTTILASGDDLDAHLFRPQLACLRLAGLGRAPLPLATTPVLDWALEVLKGTAYPLFEIMDGLTAWERRLTGEARAALLARLGDDDGFVREAVVQALTGAADDAEVRAALLARLGDDKWLVRVTPVEALAGAVGEREVRGALLTRLADDEYPVRRSERAGWRGGRAGGWRRPAHPARRRRLDRA